MIRALILAFVLLVASPALAVDFPPLSGRVVDQADLLTPAQEADLTGRLEALQRASSRQLVVVTLPNLQDLPIEDYGYQLGRHWGIGQGGANNGVILIVARTERKMRIEVGYGLEGIMTDALSGRIIRETITPFFRRDDYAGGIFAGADAIIAQLQAPPEAAEQAALAAQQAENRRASRRGDGDGDGSIVPLIFWGAILLFVVLPAFGAGFAGRRYRGRGRGGVSVWGPGTPYRRGDSGVGWMLAGMVLGSMNRGRRSGGWGGGGGGWSGGGGGGGGFSGGGGSFGGGGASGGW